MEHVYVLPVLGVSCVPQAVKRLLVFVPQVFQEEVHVLNRELNWNVWLELSIELNELPGEFLNSLRNFLVYFNSPYLVTAYVFFINWFVILNIRNRRLWAAEQELDEKPVLRELLGLPVSLEVEESRVLQSLAFVEENSPIEEPGFLNKRLQQLLGREVGCERIHE